MSVVTLIYGPHDGLGVTVASHVTEYSFPTKGGYLAIYRRRICGRWVFDRYEKKQERK